MAPSTSRTTQELRIEVPGPARGQIPLDAAQDAEPRMLSRSSLRARILLALTREARPRPMRSDREALRVVSDAGTRDRAPPLPPPLRAPSGAHRFRPCGSEDRSGHRSRAPRQDRSALRAREKVLPHRRGLGHGRRLHGHSPITRASHGPTARSSASARPASTSAAASSVQRYAARQRGAARGAAGRYRRSARRRHRAAPRVVAVSE